MVKVIDIPDENIENAFEAFCEEYDIAVFDRAEIAEIFEESGSGYALRRWRQMQRECNAF